MQLPWARGEVLTPLDLQQARRELLAAYASGLRACAIVLMHAYRYPQHELQALDLAKEIGFTQISVSHQVSPLMKLVSRGDTTVADAYLSPVLRRYVERITRELGGVNVMFMQSSGGLTDARRLRHGDRDGHGGQRRARRLHAAGRIRNLDNEWRVKARALRRAHHVHPHRARIRVDHQPGHERTRYRQSACCRF